MLLAIHSNKAILGETAPNFYEYLAVERGNLADFQKLDQEYRAERDKRPLFLSQIYQLCASGLSKNELEVIVAKFASQFISKEVKEQLKNLRNQFSKIIILTSYPKTVYLPLQKSKLVDEIFGAEGKLDENQKISALKEIQLKNPDFVKAKMKEIGIASQFTLEPNRYGMLEYLIDLLSNTRETQVTILGASVTTLPLKSIATTFIESESLTAIK